jgi:hypothetical protein
VVGRPPAAGGGGPRPFGADGGQSYTPRQTLARLVRFYGLTPQQIVETPRWALHILMDEMGGIAAGELHDAIVAAIAPHLRHDRDRRALLRDLADAARPRGRQRPGFTPELLNDLDAAAAYFSSLGIGVRRVETS